ncbi:MAG: cell division protein FtsK [Rhodospirillales bacterium 20-60-12]|nr:MAG: cell division protein FtsK [Rhodospirillales bacterium 20-60-12]
MPPQAAAKARAKARPLATAPRIESLRSQMNRRMAELAGLLAGLIGLTMLVALISYHQTDPSFNTASSLRPQNLAGPFGADLADFLLQGFGAAAILPPFFCLAWAYALATRGNISAFKWRTACALFALPSCAVACAMLSLLALHTSLHWPVAAGPGGALGDVVGQSILGSGRSALGELGMLAALLTTLITTLICVGFGLGISPGEWRAAGRGAARAAKTSAQQGHRAALTASRGAGAVSSWLTPLLRRPEMGETIAQPLERATPSARVTAPPPPGLMAGADPRPPQTPVRKPTAALKKAPPKQESLPLPESGWRFPPISLLKPAPARADSGPSEEALQANARLLENVLQDYGVQGRIVQIHPGPVVTLYELEPAPGIRSARVIGLADDVARSLSVIAVRIATVQGRNVIGIEVPNAKRETVFLSELLGAADWDSHPGKLPLALGKDISGGLIIADLARMPHLLIAGTTGSGKSVGINAMILSLLYRLSPDQCRLIMIDPKMLELSVYDGIPHLMAPVVTEPAKAVAALKWVVREMERRYRAMSQLSVRNIAGYNDRVLEARAKGEVVTRRVQTGFDSETGRPIFEEQPLALDALPFIVVVIDEMADLMMVAGKEIEAAVQRLAQMARAAGIHVIMATQRPSVDVITGTIKANFPTRISFQVISKFDSRTILGEQGAEQLLGQGDLLHMVGGGRITRVHGPFVSDREVEDVVAFLREQGEPAYVDEVTEQIDDDNLNLPALATGSDGEGGLYGQAVALVAREGKASTSFIQRHLQIGYNRAAKLIEQMEKEGVVSSANHVGKREVLIASTRDD